MTKIVAGLAGAESAPARDRTGQPTGENHQPQNAILSKFGTPLRSCGGSVGEWLSLVEHLVRDQGVGGSNPLSPTNLFKRLSRIQPSFFSCNRVQLAISVPQWACGNRVQLAPP